MRSASALCERPENTIRRFCGPRSSQWPGAGWLIAAGDSRPGRTSSVVALSGCIALIVLLARTGNPQCVGGDVLRYDRSSRDPRSVSNLHRRDEAIVDAGPDVAADRRAAFRLPGLVREVRRDRARADIGVRADLRVADVRQVRD